MTDPHRPPPTPDPGADRFADEPIVIHPSEFRDLTAERYQTGQHPTGPYTQPYPQQHPRQPYAQQPYPPAPYQPYAGYPHHMQPLHPYAPGPYGPPAPVYVTTNVHTPVVVRTSSCPHGLHLVLTLLTCGLWLPIWIIDAILRG